MRNRNIPFNEERRSEGEYEPMWEILENGRIIARYFNKEDAEEACKKKQKEADDDWLDLMYSIQEV